VVVRCVALGTHDPGCPALLRCELLRHHSLPSARPETSAARVLPRCTVSAPTWHTLGSSLWPAYGTPKGECVNKSVKQRAIVNHPQIQSSSSSSSKLLANSALHDYLSSAHIDSPPWPYDMSRPPNILHTMPSNNRLWTEICGSSLLSLVNGTMSQSSQVSVPLLSRVLQDKQWKVVLKCNEGLHWRL